MRLLLTHGVTYPYLANLLKTVYVEVAEGDFALEGKPQTTSRVSLLTGIHRKDVKRLREESAPPDATPAVVSLGAQLAARWTAVDEFLDDAGRPRALARLSADGRPSFEELVESVSKDIRPRAVLDEWLRLGVVHLDDQDRVVLNTEAFVPESGFDEKSFYFGRNVRDHVAACAHNLAGGAPPLLERSVYYDELSDASLQELGEIAERTGMEALQAVNRRAMALQERDENEPGADWRLNFGIYFYRERVEREDGDE